MYCTLSPDEVEAVVEKRTSAARLGYAISLVYLRYLGRVRDVGEQPNDMMLAFLAYHSAKPTTYGLTTTMGCFVGRLPAVGGAANRSCSGYV